VVNLAVSACVLRATTKKSRQLFEEKSAPPEKMNMKPFLGKCNSVWSVSRIAADSSRKHRGRDTSVQDPPHLVLCSLQIQEINNY